MGQIASALGAAVPSSKLQPIRRAGEWLDGAAHRIDDARKFDQKAVARALVCCGADQAQRPVDAAASAFRGRRGTVSQSLEHRQEAGGQAVGTARCCEAPPNSAATRAAKPKPGSQLTPRWKGSGFEPSVPLLRKAHLGVANRRRRHEGRSHLQVQARNGNACLERLPIAFPFAEGPRVRIRLPPANSPLSGPET
jgi:hypothetical protein